MSNHTNIQDFFFKNYKAFVRFAESYVLERATAEDIVQDMFVNYLETKDKPIIRTSLKAYFISSIKYRCLNYQRDKKIQDKHDILYIEAILNSKDPGLFTDKFINDAVQQAINELPGEMGKVFQLRFFQEKNYAEVAEILNISKNTVKTQLLRGKKKLKESLIQLSRLNFFSF